MVFFFFSVVLECIKPSYLPKTWIIFLYYCCCPLKIKLVVYWVYLRFLFFSLLHWDAFGHMTLQLSLLMQWSLLPCPFGSEWNLELVLVNELSAEIAQAEAGKAFVCFCLPWLFWNCLENVPRRASWKMRQTGGGKPDHLSCHGWCHAHQQQLGEPRPEESSQAQRSHRSHWPRDLQTKHILFFSFFSFFNVYCFKPLSLGWFIMPCYCGSRKLIQE